MSGLVSQHMPNVGMKNAKAVNRPVNTRPVNTRTKLVKAMEYSESVDQGLYQSAVSSLQDQTSRMQGATWQSTVPNRQSNIDLVLNVSCEISDILYSSDGSKACDEYSNADWGGDIDDCK